MCISKRLLLAIPLATVLLGSSPAPVAADIGSVLFLIPCNYCSLPGTCVVTQDPDGPTAQTSFLYTFNSEGTVIASDGAGEAFHGVWTRIDPFRYSMSAIRKLENGEGWQRVRLWFGHRTCNTFEGEIKMEVLDCNPALAANPTCDPQGAGWTSVGNPAGTHVSGKRYQRHPFTYQP